MKHSRPQRGIRPYSFLFMAVFGVPFSLVDWVPFNIDVNGSPTVAVEGTRFTISTDEVAGGTAYFLPEPIPLKLKELELSWEWLVEKFPNSAPAIPLEKKHADFGLRLGLILSNGNWKVPLPYRFRKEMQRRGHALTYVLFYTAVPEKIDPELGSYAFGNVDSQKQNLAKPFKVAGEHVFKPPKDRAKCTRSPFHDAFMNCFVPLEVKAKQSVTVLPIPDIQSAWMLNRMELESLQIIGIWIFADSDNSESKSKAWIENIRFASASGSLENPNKADKKKAK